MKEKILDELRFSVGIVLSREEVVPRFRVICPDGDWTVFGWLTLKEAERYTRAVEQKKMAARAMPMLERGEKRT